MHIKAQLEKIPNHSELSFYCREYVTDRLDHPWHFHPEFELTLVLGGTGWRQVGDSMERFDAGDLVLLGPDLPHFWRSDPDCRETYRVVVIQFSQQLVGALFERLPEAAGLARFLKRAARGIRLDAAGRKAIEPKMRSVCSLAGLARWAESVSLLAQLSRIGKGTYLASAGFVPVLDTDDQDRMAVVCDYVFRNFAGCIRQPEAASLASLTPSAFSRFFRRRMGKTFAAYVNEVRIGRASRLLIDSERSVTEIAYAVGYNNLANFYRQFRGVTGRTPMMVRTGLGSAGSRPGGRD